MYRFYNPNEGRWLNRDPQEELGGINIYNFVNNSPNTGIDPDGRVAWAKKDCFSFVIPVVELSGYLLEGLTIKINGEKQTCTCCGDDGEMIPEGYTAYKGYVSAELGVGIGEKIVIAGIGEGLTIKGPQAKIQATVSALKDCGSNKWIGQGDVQFGPAFTFGASYKFFGGAYGDSAEAGGKIQAQVGTQVKDDGIYGFAKVTLTLESTVSAGIGPGIELKQQKYYMPPIDIVSTSFRIYPR